MESFIEVSESHSFEEANEDIERDFNDFAPTPLFFDGDIYIPNKHRKFYSNGFLSEEDILTCFDFAYRMTYGGEGKFRSKPPGGERERTVGEIFVDAYQGKLAESAFYNLFKQHPEYNCSKPDFEVKGEGEWGTADFIVNRYNISIKSTRSFWNTMFLRCSDWNWNGEYIPNKNNPPFNIYDFFVLVRIRLMQGNKDLDGMRKDGVFSSTQMSKEALWELIKNVHCEANFAGFITRIEFVENSNFATWGIRN